MNSAQQMYSKEYTNNSKTHSSQQMTPITFKGQELKNWNDYVSYKFDNNHYFTIDRQTDNVTIHSKTNNTKIWFIQLDEKGERIQDCQYSNTDCQGWSGETCAVDPDKYGTFTLDNVTTVDSMLDTPIYKGWVSVDYYLTGRHYKSYTFEDGKKTFGFTGANFGCLTIVLFPIFIVVDVLMKFGLIGQKKEIKISSIITQ
jgi:hypothetical protein